MRPKFVLFGDSITQQSFSNGGWGAALTNQYSRKADIVLRGYSGYNTRWALFLLHKIFPTSALEPPLVATVFFGANDACLPDRSSARQHVPLAEYTENLRRIISHLKRLSPGIHIILLSPPPVDVEGLQIHAREKYGEKAGELPSRTNEVTGQYARACVSVAQESGVTAIDLWSAMQAKTGWQKACLSDGLHLSPEGNMVVFEELIKVLDGKGLAFENMEWDFPEFDTIDEKNPEKTFS